MMATNPLTDPIDDKPRLECGVFGVFDTTGAASITATTQDNSGAFFMMFVIHGL